ncbi:trypsin-like peptidase domain-containing protein [Streptomyces coffeae]|uniref:Serine protease n=1 Tax=Streptomyces coffeae TaxID=621382 RepID=A0ABS1NKT8_9ACTN|nr:trypsin-like peptidase domain-containing protein [Streptomyces coffeae]MBL1100685.1 trypsin-like peptidase domain-containing protein [Streptomyces coffeae]
MTRRKLSVIGSWWEVMLSQGGPARATLTALLAKLYPEARSVRRVLDAADIPAGMVDFGGGALDMWHAVLREADNRSKLEGLLTVAVSEFPENAELRAALAGRLGRSAVPGPSDPGAPVTATHAEKLMGSQSTLLPLSFLEHGVRAARCVGLLRGPVEALGTGFLVAGDFVVTNHHVLPDAETAAAARIVLGYQERPDGEIDGGRSFPLDPGLGFATSEDHDLTVVRSRDPLNAEWGALELAPSGAGTPHRLNIVQHPAGGPKKVALYHNVVSHSDENRLLYFTDTLPGSSGSPAFDDQWRVAAVHRAGGHLRSPDGTGHVYTNEGVPVRRLVELLATAAS